MSKISLIILGLVLLVCLTVAAREEEELSSLREVREADPEPRKNRGRKMRKGKGRRGGRRQRKRTRKGGKSGRLGGRTISAACFEQSLTIMKMREGVIANFVKQKNRMEKQNETAGKKSDKKSAFGAISEMLVQAGGGNRSAPSCGGSTTNDGAKQLANLTTTLDSCLDDIKTACDPANIPQPNMTLLKMCEDNVATFKNKSGDCLTKSVGTDKSDTATACTCWTSTDLAGLVEKTKVCKFSDQAKAIATALKSCTAAFGKCRKYEDAANTAISACSTDSTKLTEKASTLSANAAALKLAQDKVTALKSNSTRRLTRAASTCAEVITYATKLVKMSENFPSSPDIATTAAKISGANVTCSASEKASLTSVSTELDKAAATIAIALDAVQEQLLTLTGSTVSTAALTSAAATTSAGTVSTMAPGRRIRNFNIL